MFEAVSRGKHLSQNVYDPLDLLSTILANEKEHGGLSRSGLLRLFVGLAGKLGELCGAIQCLGKMLRIVVFVALESVWFIG